jgi:hypothetical protein
MRSDYHNYQTYHKMAQTRRRKLGNNTYLVIDDAPSSYAIRLHKTNIITYHTDGRVVLDSGGWQTRTTSARLNEYSPYRVYSDRGVWYVKIGDKTVTWRDGITIGPRGGITGAGGSRLADATLALRRRVGVYAKQYTDALYDGKVGLPGAGDCWGCCMRSEDGKNPMGGPSHITDHMRERYFVPSLLACAVDRVPTSIYTKDCIGRLMRGGDDVGQMSAWVRQDITKLIRRWCLRELQLVHNK